MTLGALDRAVAEAGIDTPDGAIIMLVPFTIGTALTPDAEYTGITVTEGGCVDANVVESIGIAVLLGARPGIWSGKHWEAMGSVNVKRGFDHDGVTESPNFAVTSRSTAMSSLLSSLTPVVEGLPVQTPAPSLSHD